MDLDQRDPWLSDAMRVEQWYARIEPELVEAYGAAMRGFLEQARADVLAGAPTMAALGDWRPNLDRWPSLHTWVELLTEHVVPVMLRWYRRVFRQRVEADPPEQREQQFIREITTALRDDQWPERVVETVWEETQGSVQQDDPPRLLAERIRRVLSLDAPVRSIRQEIVDRERAGEPVPEELTNPPGESSYAHRNAARERARWGTVASYNRATLDGADQQETDEGVQLLKQWWATTDQRTRPAHWARHKQAIPRGEPFQGPSGPVRYPGDPLAAPEERINCRCALLIVDEDEAAQANEERARELPNRTDVHGNPVEDYASTPTPTMAHGGATMDGDDTSETVTAQGRMPGDLKTYWTRGEGAAKIRWGTSGDFDRCKRQLREYVRPDQLNGLCANLHHEALGKWPGAHASATASDADIGDDPCPCDELTPEQINTLLSDTVTADVSEEKRERAEEAGHAMEGGRFPIETREDLENAIRAVGRAKGGASGRAKVRRHIMRQARRLGLTDLIPDTWNSDGTLKAAASASPWCERVAAAVPMEPPARWFIDPELTGPTKVRVTDQGRVYGHVAQWGVEHAGIPGVTADLFADDPLHRFHRHPVRTADGSKIKTGPLATGGHADDDSEIPISVVQSHYDDPRFVVADVAAGYDDHGIWISGALRPGVSPFQVQLLDRYSISGDWRNGELLAACSVSVPGFHLDDDDQVVALSASAAPGQPRLAEHKPRARWDQHGEPTVVIACGVVSPSRADAPQLPMDSETVGWAVYRATQRAARTDRAVTASARRVFRPGVTQAADRVLTTREEG